MSDEATPTTCAIVRVPPLDLDAIEVRANAATVGPWKLGPTPHYEVTMADGRPLHATWFGSDARFIAAARSDVPALCAEVRRLRRMLARAEGWIRSGAEKIDMLDGDVDGACANAREFADELRVAIPSGPFNPDAPSPVPIKCERCDGMTTTGLCASCAMNTEEG